MELQPVLSSSLSEDLSSQLSRDPYEDHRAFAAHALSRSLFKKNIDNADLQTCNSRALEKFLQCNRDVENFRVSCETSLDEMLLGDYYRSFSDFFERALSSGDTWFTLPECFALGYAGPGASVRARGSDFYTKFFDSPLSYTSKALYSSFEESLQFDPTWAQAEFLRLSRYGTAEVPGSRLSFVPKTKEVSRTVCTEPSLNMFYQLGLGCILIKQLRRQFGVSLRDQPAVNRDMALRGSIDGSFATIDLESASDRIGFHLLPKRFYGRGLIELLRSPITRLPDGSNVPLHMVSTMGCGFTFPLMTLIFMCVVISSYVSLGITPRFGKDPNACVFGDDIVVVSEARYRVLRLLHLLGMKVNEDKSFFEGPFRESCGYDFFRGHFVRGVYSKSLRTVQDRVSLVNRLNRWSYETGISLPRTVTLLLQDVDVSYVNPLYESDDSGVHVPLSLIRPYVKYKERVPVYKSWENRPSSLFVRPTRIVSPRTAKKRQVNSLGLLVCLLEGSLRSGRITIRKDRKTYKTKFKMSPYWDAILAERFYSTVYRRRLERAVWLNLSGWIDSNLVSVS